MEVKLKKEERMQWTIIQDMKKDKEQRTTGGKREEKGGKRKKRAGSFASIVIYKKGR